MPGFTTDAEPGKKMLDFAYLGNLVIICPKCNSMMTALEFPAQGRALISCHKYLCSENGLIYSAELPKITLEPVPDNKP